MKPDHSSALESLAAEHNRNPLHVFEWFLERAAIREYDGGMSRAEAERLAVEDVRDELEGRGLPVASVSPSECGSDAPQMQSCSTSNSVASGRVR